MATNIASLGIKIEASDIKKAVAELNRLEKQGKKTETAANKLRNSFSGLGTAISALGLIVLTKKLIDQVSVYQSLTNKLRLVTEGTEQLTQVQSQLFDVAQDTRASYEATIDLYARFARSTESLGLSQTDLLGITESVNQAVAISGSNAQSSAAALFQLGQGLAADALRGQELNSVMEQTPRLARAIADGLGVEIGALRDLAAQGALTSKVVTEALRSQADVLAKEFGNTEKTISQAFQQIENAALKTFGSIEGGDFVDSMDEFRNIISDPALVKGLQNAAGLLLDIANLGIKAASGWGMLFQLISDTKLENATQEMEALANQLNALSTASGPGNFFRELVGIDNQVLIDSTTQKMRLLSEEIERLQNPREMVSSGGGGGGGNETVQGLTDDQIASIIERDRLLFDARMQLESELTSEEMEVLQEKLDEKNELEKDANEKRLDNYKSILQLEIDEEAKAIKQKEALEARYSKTVTGMKFDVAQQAIALGNMLVKEGSSASKALLVISKGLAIAQIAISTEMAAIGVLAPAPVGLGYVAGTPIAASIRTMGAASMGLVAATGLAQISGSGGGGGVGSTAVGSVSSAESEPFSDLNRGLDTQNQRGSVTINVSGVMTDEIVNDLVIPAIQDAVDDRDVVLIRGDSRNAQEIIAA